MGKESFVRSTVENLAQSYIDALFEEDAKGKQSSGISSVITRRQLWHCCEWCASLAGSYEYAPGKYPKDIFRRHQNCRCMVTVKTDRSGYTDVWSKKEYESQREARIAREAEITHKELYEEYQKKIRITKDSGETYAEVTEYWKNKPKIAEGTIKDTPKVFEYKGKTFTQDGIHIFIDNDQDAAWIEKILADRYGGYIQRFPRIQQIDGEHPGEQTPDFFWDGIAYDAKGIHTDNAQALYNAIHRKEDQAHRFVVDVSEWNVSSQQMRLECRNLFRAKGWLEQIILLADGKVSAVYEKI